METTIDLNRQMLYRIRSRDQKTLALLYKESFPMVLSHVCSNNGSREDAQDVFQDAFYLLIRKCEDPAFELTSHASTFLMGISKNLWMKRLTKSRIDPGLYQAELLVNETESSDADEQKLRKVRYISESINSLGEPCRTLLVNYYYKEQTMKEIAALLHYTNADNAKNQKYKCLQRLKRMVTGSND